MTLPAFKKKVEDDQDVAGDWRSDPEDVFSVTIENAKTWPIVEALERWDGNSEVAARANDLGTSGETKDRTEK